MTSQCGLRSAAMRSPHLFLLIVLLAAACVAPADRARLEEEHVDALEPTFAPLPSPSAPLDVRSEEPTADVSSAVPGRDGPPSDDPGRTAPGTPPATPTEASTPSVPPDASGRLDDPAGDVTGLSPPDWADLRSAEIVRQGTTFTLTHTADGAFPEQGDGTNTMNIATFFDVDGDGNVDYEVWANLSPEGWGTSYFDEREGTARYAADDDVDVEVVESAVQLRFPTTHLAEAPSFRWSIASEYGPYEAIGTDAMARDYLPDDRSGQPFPG